MPIVSMKNISRRKGSTEALHDVSLDIVERESLVILGPSGSGKTTLLRIIAGLEAPDAGTVAFGEEVVSEPERVLIPPETRGLSFVFQDLALWPHMTVRGNIAFALKGQRWPGPRRSEALERALELCELADLADRRPHQLSGGQQQLVALARALATEPALVLMDEPLANLDAKLREAMRERIANLRHRLGFACVYVTHDQEDAFALGDRIAVLRAGSIEQVGTPETVYREPASRFVAEFIGKGAVIAGTARADGSTETCLGIVPPSDRASGGPIEVFVRPEQLRAGSSDGAPGTVSGSRYIEGRWMVNVQIGDERVAVWSECPLDEGTDTRVELIERPWALPRSEG